MNLIKITLLALFALGLASCKKEKDEHNHDDHDHGGGGGAAIMNLRFNFVHGVNPFDINTNYTDGAGQAMRFSTLKFYVSEIHLEDDAGATVADFGSKVLLADGATPNASYELGSMNPGHVHEIHFKLGLNSTVNHADPTSAVYPLNIPGMHWSWNPAAGYKFLNMEGHVDGNGDGDFDDVEDKVFTYHCATDALLRSDHVHFHAEVNGGNVTLEAKVDVAMLLLGLNLLDNSVAMGAGPNNVAAMDNLVVAVTQQ
ncbi:MAG TPA: hypothetical protein PKY96_13125 [Flavobacteriales bacterium]|nr:hypothetical protein [Flavobacteriales bacterium]